MGVERPHKGLYTDSLKSDQPKDTYTFALNAVLEGEGTFLSNEQSNKKIDGFPDGFTPIGKIHLDNNNSVIFSVSSNQKISEIGILNNVSKYKTYVNDENSAIVNKLNFRTTNQIQGFYRSRRGCHRTIYFTDNYNRPRYFDFDKVEEFKIGNEWVSRLFDLQKSYYTIPVVSYINVLDSGGSLLPGSYNISIQYLDNNLNPTEWINTTDVIKIYNDSYKTSYKDINGSVNLKEEYLHFGNSNKSIYVEILELDIAFSHYRLAFIEAISGTGNVTSVKVTDLIPISSKNSSFTYTGLNFSSEISEADILAFNDIIEKAGSIGSLENRLHLGNTAGKDVNFCKLQKYASIIAADCLVVKKSIGISKNPIQNFISRSYMPGEIYSFGIVYIFDDNTLSPVFHIPGRSPKFSSEGIFSPYVDSNNKPISGTYVCPMRVDDLTQEVYDNSKICGGDSYWGLDVLGNKLGGEKVRHHRFPTRFEADSSGDSRGAFLQQNEIFTHHFTIRFSNIQKPFPEDIGGLNIVGYYIVNNERTESNKTILDSGVIFHSVNQGDKVAVGLLNPNNSGSSYDTGGSNYIYGFLNPEYKFNNRKYNDVDEIIVEGMFHKADTKYGKVCYRDVNDGTTYNKDIDVKEDKNGWAIEIGSRDTIIEYGNITKDLRINSSEIEEIFYLDALESRYAKNTTIDVFNVSSDNKIGIIHTNTILEFPDAENLPYILLKRNLRNPYSNFRTLPYYLSTNIPHYFHTSTRVINVNSGDTYISSMRYTNTIFYNNRIALREIKSHSHHGFLRVIGGVFLALAGAVLAAFTGGTSVILSEVGFSLLGSGALLASSGLKSHNYKKTYHEAYNSGLRDAIKKDEWVRAVFEYENNNFGKVYLPLTYNNKADGVEDDTIQWLGDCITDLWFQSGVNIGLRSRMVNNETPTFLNSPGNIEDGNNSQVLSYTDTGHFSGDSSSSSVTKTLIRSVYRPPFSSLENHLVNKLLKFSDKREDNMQYLGVALGEFYYLNPDYDRKNKQKTFYHLPVEYDCCSECSEEFPHRWRWSEQSFQEELSDNFRTFLPNNYKDIPGETGEIMNIFSIGNNMYIHTKEALWIQPRNYQERVTDQIVSFIGTGSYGDVPPRKIINDETGMSAGLTHKWSALNTKYGYFFACENESTIYKFDGQKLINLSFYGLHNWFKENTELKLDLKLREISNKDYVYRDNPSSPIGTGYLLTYDNEKERVLATKKDFIGEIQSDLSDSKIIGYKNSLVSFPDYKNLIKNNKKDGWYLSDVKDGQLEFSKIDKEDVDGYIYQNSFQPGIKYETHIFHPSTLSDSVILDYINDVSSKDDVYVHVNDTGKWLEYPKTILDDHTSRNIILISFDSDSSYYDNGDLNAEYHLDYDNFINNLYPQFNSFIGIHYPLNPSEDHIVSLENAVNGNKFHPNPNVSLNHLRNYGWVSFYREGSFDEGGDIDLGGLDTPGEMGGKKLPTAVKPIETTEKPEDETGDDDKPRGVEATGHADDPGQGTGGSDDARPPTVKQPERVPTTITSGGGPYYAPPADKKFMKVYMKYSSTDCNVNSHDSIWYMERHNVSTAYQITGLTIYANKELTRRFIFTQYSEIDSIIWFDPLNKKPKYKIKINSKNGEIIEATKCDVPPPVKKVYILVGEMFCSSFSSSSKTEELVYMNDINVISSSDLIGQELFRDEELTDRYTIIDSIIWFDNNTKYPRYHIELNFNFEIQSATLCPIVKPKTKEEVHKDIVKSTSSSTKIKIIKIKRPIIDKKSEEGDLVDLKLTDNSWTLSHDLRSSRWVSWHSYTPNFYIGTSNKLYSWIQGVNDFWEHNVKNHYQNYYGIRQPHVVEYVSVTGTNNIWNFLKLITIATSNGHDVSKTYNKAVLYNSKQCSGLLNLKVKDKSDANYFTNQIVNNDNEIIINRVENNWFINNFRDIRIDYNAPIWKKSNELNEDSLDINKDWTQLQSFRDKYLVVRLIFDNTDDVKLVTDYFVDNPQKSIR